MENIPLCNSPPVVPPSEDEYPAIDVVSFSIRLARKLRFTVRFSNAYEISGDEQSNAADLAMYLLSVCPTTAQQPSLCQIALARDGTFVIAGEMVKRTTTITLERHEGATAPICPSLATVLIKRWNRQPSAFFA